MTTLGALLDDCLYESPTKAAQDRRFVDLMKAFLRTDEHWSTRLEQVWSWDEWPESEGPADVVDLVAQERDTGDLVAVRCAFQDPDEPLAAADLAQFLSASADDRFGSRLVIATTDAWDQDATDGQEAPAEVSRIGLTDLFGSSMDWAALDAPSSPTP